MAKKAWDRKPTSFPSRQCPNCQKYYHARTKECPGCGTKNPTASGVTRKVKKVRVKRKTSGAARRGVGRGARGQAPVDVLHRAIEFVEAAGGLANAKAALETIERVQRL